ncbi:MULTISPECIES: NDMA-dependent alcohol dehydrogenase [Amycolatopsis]|uniref:Alcohol dehydrogenase n=2 Tax=Amycolatopsis TaxID=1813 RepID=A0ABQ3IXE5_9PSEU|nr:MULTISPECIES: NDMA-dependent alcohol dehydrogenase [Amycolatopsis]MDQ0382547.1 S-(hydroxymethyl)glutathione dehydrogenase/alcohol dehydrogenase [Amycolatopsis thermophila]GHE93918.1 alcohol dehydrogenase [Amycolatopsis deserti]
MLTRGAIVREAPGEYEVVDLELDDPQPDEVQVKVVASGLCHSDDHIATGDIPVGTYPFAGGHEGAGVVTKAHPNRKGIKEGDHVVFLAVPVCGHCRFCASGRQALCDLGAGILAGPRWTDGTYRLHTADGTPVGQMCGISTFVSTTTVSLDSVVKIDDDIPLDKACLVGCGVGTGWGSAVNAAAVQPGDTVIVMGAGGIGVNALQGAAHAGATTIIAVDPVPFKRESAPTFGATHAVETMDEAAELARQFTNGQGADSAILTVGVLTAEHVGQGLAAIRKDGTCVVTAMAPLAEVGAQVALGDLALSQKRLQGTLFGHSNPTWDIRRQLQLYRDGALKLDELVTRTYTLDEVTQGYRDMHEGKNIRGVIRHD